MIGKEITSMSLINYGNWEDLEKLLVGKRITYWSDDYIELDDDIMLRLKKANSRVVQEQRVNGTMSS